MHSSYEIQKQVKDNAEELQTFLSDLASWSGKVNSEPSENKNRVNIDKPIPPIRNHSKKRESNDGDKNPSGTKVTKRISSFDYDKWDKFDVEKACEDIDNVASEKDSVEMSLKLRDEAHYEKERGNRFVKNGKWDDAIVCYSKAIKCYPKDATFYANRALCYLKKKQFRSVEGDCTAALQLEADYVKALQRRASARRELNQLEDALKDLHKALGLEPNNTALKADLAVVKQKLSGDATSKAAQVKEPLKWTPPVRRESASEAGTSGSSSRAKEPSPSPSPPLPTPGLITPAKKHLKSGSVSVGEDPDDQPEPKQMQKQKPNVSSAKMPPKEPPKERPKQSIKWYAKEGTSLVLPVTKPPHRRSKVPLKRLSIKECPNYDLSADLESTAKNLTGKEENRSLDEGEIRCSGDVTKTENVKTEKSDAGSQIDENDLPVPSTSVQFIKVWKLTENNSQLRFKFLKKIAANDLPKIFQDCLESDLFSGIIHTFEMEFIKEGVPVFEYLVGLSKVRRFSMLTMFMSTADKHSLQKLFEYCQTTEGCSKESVNSLKKIYEL